MNFSQPTDPRASGTGVIVRAQQCHGGPSGEADPQEKRKITWDAEADAASARQESIEAIGAACDRMLGGKSRVDTPERPFGTGLLGRCSADQGQKIFLWPVT